ncbi:DUF262 domain-containing protein [Mycena kentingensis (nom. inval.)]|nr:DUF262 domain-containing protein [Mycena kentingensis (nom. inval.)]
MLSDDEYDSDASEVGHSVGTKFPKPQSTSWNTGKLFKLLQSNRINLDAEYQRAEVWRREAQGALIDSLHKNAPVSQLILAKRTENNWDIWHVIDGKQRLTALRLFMSGEASSFSSIIPFRESESKQLCWYVDKDAREHKGRGRPKVVLSDSEREEFDLKDIPCLIYDKNLTPEQERNIFSRLQCGRPLTTAERLNAQFTEHTNLARETLAKFLDNPASPLHTSTKFGLLRTRGTPFRYLVSIIHALEKDELKLKLVGENDAWIAARLKPGVKDALQAAMEVYEAIAGTSDALATIAPAQFLASVVFVHRYRETATFDTLVQGIRDMHADVRKKNPGEVKSTAKVYKVMQEFMEEWATGVENTLGRGAVSATEQVRLWRCNGKSRKKRKQQEREEDDDDDDDEEDSEHHASRKRAAKSKAPAPRRPMRISSPSASPISTPKIGSNNNSPGSTPFFDAGIEGATVHLDDAGTSTAAISSLSGGFSADFGSMEYDLPKALFFSESPKELSFCDSSLPRESSVIRINRGF